MKTLLKKIEKALNLAQCEIRALYKRVGYSDSNVLTLIDEAWNELRQFHPVKESTDDEFYDKIYNAIPYNIENTILADHIREEIANLVHSALKQSEPAKDEWISVKMRTNCDCMIASFAGLMGWSYDEAKTYFPEKARIKTGYRWEFLIPYLQACKIYLSWFPTKDHIDWSKPAMLDVASLTAPDKGDHIIFWDGTKIIDPSAKEPHYTEIPDEINCAYQINEKWTKAPHKD